MAALPGFAPEVGSMNWLERKLNLGGQGWETGREDVVARSRVGAASLAVGGVKSEAERDALLAQFPKREESWLQADSLLEEVFAGFPELMATTLEWLEGASTWALVGGGLGAVGGFLVGGPAGAIAAGKGGATVGALVGGAAKSLELEAGNLYIDLLAMQDPDGKRIPLDVAYRLAWIGGMGAAGLETAGMGMLGKAMAKTFGGKVAGAELIKAMVRNPHTYNAILKSMDKPLLRAAGSAVAAMGPEIATEVGQEMITLGAQNVAAAVANSNGAAFELSGVGDYVDTALETARKVATGLVPIGVTNAAGGYARARGRLNQAKARQRALNQNLSQISQELANDPVARENPQLLSEAIERMDAPDSLVAASDVLALYQKALKRGEITPEEFHSQFLEPNGLSAREFAGLVGNGQDMRVKASALPYMASNKVWNDLLANNAVNSITNSEMQQVRSRADDTRLGLQAARQYGQEAENYYQSMLAGGMAEAEARMHMDMYLVMLGSMDLLKAGNKPGTSALSGLPGHKANLAGPPEAGAVQAESKRHYKEMVAAGIAPRVARQAQALMTAFAKTMATRSNGAFKAEQILRMFRHQKSGQPAMAGQALNQAMAPSEAQNIIEFINEVQAWKGGQKKRYFTLSPENGFLSGLRFQLPHDTVLHVAKGHPDITIADYALLPEILNKLTPKATAIHQRQGKHDGTPVIAYATHNKSGYILILRVDDNGRIVVRSFFKDTSKKTKQYFDTNKNRAAVVPAALWRTQALQAGTLPTVNSANNITQTNHDGNSGGQTLFQPLNPGVNLDAMVPVIEAQPRFTGHNPLILRKRFPAELKQQVLDSFPVLNEEQGVVIAASSKKFDEYLKFAEDEDALNHLEAVAVLPELMRTARLVESSRDRYGIGEIQWVHRYRAVLRLGEKDYSIRLMVFEYNNGLQLLDKIDKLYHLKLEKEMPAGISPPAFLDSSYGEASADIDSSAATYSGRIQGAPPRTPSAKPSAYSLRQLLDGVNDSEGNTYFQENFENDKRGSISFLENHNPFLAVINYMKTANASTPPHEFAHFARRMLEFMAAQPGTDTQVMADWQAAGRYVEAPDGNWRAELDEAISLYGAAKDESGNYVDERVQKAYEIYEAREEKFANAFLTYLREGKAPSKELRGVFERFRNWLLSIYRAIRGEILPEINAELRGLFDRMLATDEQIAEGNAEPAPDAGQRAVQAEQTLQMFRPQKDGQPAMAGRLSDQAMATDDNGVTLFQAPHIADFYDPAITWNTKLFDAPPVQVVDSSANRPEWLEPGMTVGAARNAAWANAPLRQRDNRWVCSVPALGRDVAITHKGLKEQSSNVNKDAVAQAYGFIPQLLQNSNLLRTEMDVNSKDRHAYRTHHLYAPFWYDGKLYAAHLTIKEKRLGDKTWLNYYGHQMEEALQLPGFSGAAESGNPLSVLTNASFNIKIIDLLEAVKRKGSRIPPDLRNFLEAVQQRQSAMGGRIVNQAEIFQGGEEVVGVITSEMAASLPLNKAGYIYILPTELQHIEKEHGKQIAKIGFSSAMDFIHYVVGHIDAIYPGRTKQFYVLVNRQITPHGMVVSRLVFRQEGDGYKIITALPMRASYLKNKTPLWERAQSNHSPKGTPGAVSGLSEAPLNLTHIGEDGNSGGDTL